MKQKTPDVVLAEMAATFRRRNAEYKENFRMVGKVMAVLFPDGIPAALLHADHWHLFELKIVKLTRFAASGLTHVDSVHDDAVYSAMIESCLLEKTCRNKPKAENKPNSEMKGKHK